MLAVRRALPLLAMLAACVHSHALPAHRDPALITRAEIDGSGAMTALDAIRRLRPQYLTSRGASSLMLDPQLHPVVFLDQQPYGDIALLDQLHATDVEEIRYYTGAEATQKFGSQYGGGVIQVISRQP